MYTAFLIAPADRDNANDKPEVTLFTRRNQQGACKAMYELICDLAAGGAVVSLNSGEHARAFFPAHPQEIGHVGIIPTHELN